MRVVIINTRNLAAVIVLGLLCTALIKSQLLTNVWAVKFFRDGFLNIAWADLLNFKTVFISIILEALPFMMLGVFVSAILQNFISEAAIRRVLLRNRFFNIFLACFLGVLFPVCECGIVPVARRLVSKGVPLYSAITFMLAAPIINPVVFSSTAFAFSANPKMVWFRLGLAFLVSFITGLLVSLLFTGSELRRNMAPNHCGCGCNHEHDHFYHFQPTVRRKILNTLQNACDEFFDMGKYLILGACLAAIAQTFVARDVLLNIGQDSLSSIAAMITFAFGISVCSSADAFIAASFAGNFTTGSLLAFLVFGPMIDVKNILMLLNAFNIRFVLMLFVIVGLLVAGSTYMINLVAIGG